jgi:Homeodomain-like domain
MSDWLKLGMEDGRNRDGRKNLNYDRTELRRNNSKSSKTSQPIVKERIQVLYWLKQEKAPSISKIAKAIGRHRGTLQEWLRIYLTEGLAALETVTPPDIHSF